MQKIIISTLVLVFSFAANASRGTRYDEIKSGLVGINGKYPQSTKLINIGESDSGMPIVGIQIGNGATHNMIVATHHGNEYGSTFVAMALAETLAAKPIADQTVFVIPVLNIAGYNANQRREPAKNTTWDPNRNYPGPCATEGPFTLKSTAALAQFVDQNNIIASATLHTYAGMVLYPWGISTKQTSTPYDTTFIELGKLAAQESKYQVGNSTDLLYPADGTFEDYAFWKHGIWSLLFEMGGTHSPSQNQMVQMAQANVPGLYRMLLMAPKVRAPDHAFHGQCNVMKGLDRHDE